MKNSSAEYKLASLDRLRAVHPLLQSRERGMVAKSTKFVLKTAFGLKCKSPKEKEKNAAEREKPALMCVLGREASPKDRLIKEGRGIAAEHDFHAQNDKSPSFHIAEAHVRENLCFRLFGGGAGTRTRVRRKADLSVYGRSLQFVSRESGSCRQDPSAPARVGVPAEPPGPARRVSRV
jgi:hypothetical protein